MGKGLDKWSPHGAAGPQLTSSQKCWQWMLQNDRNPHLPLSKVQVRPVTCTSATLAPITLHCYLLSVCHRAWCGVGRHSNTCAEENYSYLLLSTYYKPGRAVSMLCALICLFMTTNPMRKVLLLTHFIDVETEPQSREVIFPRLQS